MSRLINPGLGDVADRLSVLALKILFGLEAGKNVDHFRNERNALLTKVNARSSEVGTCLDLFMELAAVNGALWHAEDDLRVLRGREAKDHEEETFYLDAGRLAFRIQGLNDQRAACIGAINDKAGDALGSEKL